MSRSAGVSEAKPSGSPTGEILSGATLVAEPKDLTPAPLARLLFVRIRFASAIDLGVLAVGSSEHCRFHD